MLFFLDESGTDHREAPYEVLAAVAIHESDLWRLIVEVEKSEIRHFGMSLAQADIEVKGARFLKRKVFRLGSQGPAMLESARTELARTFLEKALILEAGRPAEPFRRDEYTAYGQAAQSFVMSLFDLVAAHNGKAFAAIVHPQAPKPGTDFLRRDYAFLFQRFFYYLEDRGANETGILVFDEYERTSCVKLIDRMTRYFRDTNTGRIRSQRILPEPFFVHSDLTTLVRIADLVAYSLNWAFRVKGMTHEARVELAPYADKVNSIQYRGKRLGVDGKEWPVFGLFYLDDLRPTIEKVPSGKRKGLASVLARITRTK